MKNRYVASLLIVICAAAVQTATAEMVTMNMYREFGTPGSWTYSVRTKLKAGDRERPTKSKKIESGNKQTKFSFDSMANTVTVRIFPQPSDSKTFNDIDLISDGTPMGYEGKVIALNATAQPRFINESASKRR